MGASGSDGGTVELCDDGWLAAAGRIATDLVAESGHLIPGERLSICEVFNHPPTHLRRGGDKVYWTLTIGCDGASAVREERRDADIVIDTEYESALVGARAVYPEAIAAPGPDAPPPTEAQKKLAALSPALRLMLRRLHNRLAVITR